MRRRATAVTSQSSPRGQMVAHTSARIPCRPEESWSMSVPAVPKLRQQTAVVLGCLLMLVTVACGPLQNVTQNVVQKPPAPPLLEPQGPAAGNVQPVTAVQQAADVPPGRI